MQLNEVRGPIRTALGFHIVQVVERKPPPAFKMVVPRLTMILRLKKLQTLLEKKAEMLRSDAQIQILVPWGK